MIPRSACQPWRTDHPGPCRKARPSAVSYTTPKDTISRLPRARKESMNPSRLLAQLGGIENELTHHARLNKSSIGQIQMDLLAEPALRRSTKQSIERSR